MQTRMTDRSYFPSQQRLLKRSQMININRLPTQQKLPQEKNIILDKVAMGSRAVETLPAIGLNQKPMRPNQKQVNNWSRLPTQESVLQRILKRDFIFDGVAVGSQAAGKGLPGQWGAIPPSNAQDDQHARKYFQKPSVRALLKKTGKDHSGTSTAAWKEDYNPINGQEQRFLNRRNRNGADFATTQSAAKK